MSTVTPIRLDVLHRQVATIAQALERRVEAILTLAADCATANEGRCQAGQDVKLWPSDTALIGGLLPHLTADEATATLLDIIDRVFASRATKDAGRERSDAEVEDIIEGGRDVAREAIIADTLAAGAAPNGELVTARNVPMAGAR